MLLEDIMLTSSDGDFLSMSFGFFKCVSAFASAFRSRLGGSLKFWLGLNDNGLY